MKCKCGCGSRPSKGRQYISGHNLVGLVRTEEHSRKIGEAQRLAWMNKRKRLPVGSTNLDAHGYTRVKVHAGLGEWKKEHIIVMEDHIGRRLTRDEVIHHINGIRTDNHIDNLYLCTTIGAHSRVERSAKVLVKQLLRDGIMVFDKKRGCYELAS